ncbi:aminopeptidase N [Plantactinospora sp. KBS50]|uniref:aminopeptidase N n=1 Tax=Plantactinospora sp. KBS50 TaxID=2024580 RepID=UPI0012FD97C0|nr:aminopeptidase N [Plantactinospora sp. KBS50]
MTSLTRDEARTRAELLRVRRYDVELDLTGLLCGTTLRSRSTVDFSARRTDEPIFVDIVADEVRAWLDGAALPAEAYDGERLTLPALGGDHQLVVAASTDRTEQRTGIHRWVDPADGGTYVWTSFEPDDARRVFACFDQPDLKAVVAFTVHAPAGWTVVSNSAVLECTDRAGDTAPADGTRPADGTGPVDGTGPADDAGSGAGAARTWRFADTPRMSPYVTVVCAGPFHQVRRTVDGYDLAVLARRSLAAHLDRQAPELFDLTAAGLRFFGEQFDMPFPQRTYTQVFCPDFQGAMENWGCVTWMDSALYRTEPTDAQRERRAVVLLHEMAHMWFGDLVTMRWWDDLWLNESFADWAAMWAAERCTPFTGAWVSFLGDRKEAGYSADGGPTTHPVRQEIATVDDARAAFDRVTYSKGASVLRQLTAYTGEEPFVAGLRRHFARHAYGNATLEDLLASVAGPSGRDLATWAREWLLTAGTDTMSVRTDTDAEGRYRSVEVLVEPPAERPANRPHRLAVGVYDITDDRPVLRRRVELDAAPPATAVPELAGAPAADLLLVNDADLTFARVRPDAPTRAAMLRYGPSLPDPLSRAVTRLTLWHLVEDGLLAPDEVVRYAARALAVETDPAARAGLLGTAERAVRNWVDASAVPAVGDELAAACAALARAAGERDEPATVRAALRAALAVAYRPERLAELDELVGDDVDLRWHWLTQVAATGGYDPDAVAKLLDRDPDPDSAGRAAAVRAARPDSTAKDEVWREIFTGALPLPMLPAVGQAFWDPGQGDLLAPFADRFLDELPTLGGGMTTVMVTIGSLFPTHGVDRDFPARVEAAADRLPPLAAARVLDRSHVLGQMLRARAVR